MKPLRWNAAILALGSALMVLSGCAHKKPVLVAPPAAAAPEASPTPEASTQPSDQEKAAQEAQPAAPDQTKPETAQSDQPKPPKKPSPRKVAPASPNGDKSAEVARNNPPRKIIPADKATPTPPAGQISPGSTPAGTVHDQNSTEQLLSRAEANLNGIKRQLSKDEENVRSQVKEFIAQSRRATGENDPTRAHNLAVKASLLSDELTKER